MDHPAHLVEGFAVIKSASRDQNRALFSALRKETMPNEIETAEVTEVDVAEVLKGLSVDELRVALTEEQLAELATPVEKDASEEDILKGLPENVLAEFKKRDAEIEKARAAADEARRDAEVAKAARADEQAITKSREEFTNLGFDHAVVAPALRKFAETDSDAAEAIQTMLKAVNAQADGAIFKEIGDDRTPDEKAPYDVLKQLAEELSNAEGIAFSKAFEKVVADPANADKVHAHFTTNKESN